MLVEKNPAKFVEGRKNGVTVVGWGAQAVPFMSFNDWIAPIEGFILLCTKTYNNLEVLARLPDNAFLVAIQNGFDLELEKGNYACEGIVSFVSECQRDRPVTRITRPGSLYIGARRSVATWERDEIASLARALGKARLFPVKLVTDIRPYKATKLMYNAAISPLARIGLFHPDTVSLILSIPILSTFLAKFFEPSLRGTYGSMYPDIAFPKSLHRNQGI